MGGVAVELRARLRDRRDLLREFGRLCETSRIDKHGWWTEAEPVECFWIHGWASTRQANAHTWLRDGAEALALLGALARVDQRRLVQYLRALWPLTSRVSPTETPRWVVGYSRDIFASADYADISERIVGVQRPTHKFLRDFDWLQNALRSTGDLGVDRWRPIPVRVAVNVLDANTLAFLLRQILQDIIVQHQTWQLARMTDYKLIDEVTASTRFHIVEVSLDQQFSVVTINVEALECLARIVHFGIRLGRLPTIQEPNESSQELLSVTESLRELIPAGHGNASTPSSIDYVFVSNDTSARFIPALFSALQVNKTVKCVDLEVERRAFQADGGESFENARRMWQWAAYALFSRYADHGLKKVILDIEYLDDFAVESMEEVLRSKNPFSILFQSDFGSQRWISASRFNLYHPQDTHNDAMFIAQIPLRVRLIDELVTRRRKWWRVLLPGCGMAWVATSDATELSQEGDQVPSMAGPHPFHLHCVNFREANVDVLMRYLRLAPDLFNGIELEALHSVHDGFDMTDWTVTVLRLLPNLEEVSYAWHLEIARLRIFADVAETGKCRLRHLSLDQTLNVDTMDVIDFLDVLCDTSHPLTKSLEEITIRVSASESSASDFQATWRRASV